MSKPQFSDARPNRIHDRNRCDSVEILAVPRDLRMTGRQLILGICASCFLTNAHPILADDAMVQQARDSMRRAAEFYRSRIAVHGGYVYYTSLDLRQRWGEGPASKDQIWVQPPGTPTVGLAYLSAWRATGDTFYRDAAKDAARAIAYGQLQSGGWTNLIDFDPLSQRAGLYRNGRGRGKNNSSLDDGQTQSALRLLMQTDQALGFQDKVIHEAAQIGLEALLQAQFSNGAFPQVWTQPVVDQPVLKARFPQYEWRTEGRIKNYWDMYTLNDNVAGYVSEVLVDAHRIYGDERFLNALKRLGDFLVLAQMPEPQPAWAQQYSFEMYPIWARRFEPPAISGWESQDAVETLIRIAATTGERQYLEPIAAAVEYLETSRLSDGRLARYYELKSNRPLYMQRRSGKYTLTYDRSLAPDHYGWTMPSRLAELRLRWQRVLDSRPLDEPESLIDLTRKCQTIVNQLDEQGRWVSEFTGQPLPGDQQFRDGDRFIGSDVFSENLETLSRYLTRTTGVKGNE